MEDLSCKVMGAALFLIRAVEARGLNTCLRLAL